MQIIDTTGLKCPAPLIATKRALNEVTAGESVQVITDSQTSFSNISRFLKDNNTFFTFKESENVWAITIVKGTGTQIEGKAEDYCLESIPHLSRGRYVIAFASDKMGEGDQELGQVLMVNYVKALKELDLLPDKIVFYNKGVMLGTLDSPVSNYLIELEKLGVDLLFCTTCIEYFSLEDKMAAGISSNMFEIARVMASASSVIKP